MNSKPSITEYLKALLKQQLIKSYFIFSFCTAILMITLLSSACTSTEPVVNIEVEETQSPTKEEVNPSISGIIQLLDFTADGDTVKTSLGEASLSIRNIDGLPLSTTRTNLRGEFLVELDAFRHGEQYDLFVYSRSNNVMRNIRFLYTIENSNNIEILLDRENRTTLNIDYLDLNTGEGRGDIITNE